MNLKVPVCGSSNWHVKYFNLATNMRVFSACFFKVSAICLPTAKALPRLHSIAGSPEYLLVVYVISTIFSCDGSYIICQKAV